MPQYMPLWHINYFELKALEKSNRCRKDPLFCFAFFFFLAVSLVMQDLSSLTLDGTCVSCSESVES